MRYTRTLINALTLDLSLCVHADGIQVRGSAKKFNEFKRARLDRETSL
jgi:hypothetical protein